MYSISHSSILILVLLVVIVVLIIGVVLCLCCYFKNKWKHTRTLRLTDVVTSGFEPEEIEMTSVNVRC